MHTTPTERTPGHWPRQFVHPADEPDPAPLVRTEQGSYQRDYTPEPMGARGVVGVVLAAMILCVVAVAVLIGGVL